MKRSGEFWEWMIWLRLTVTVSAPSIRPLTSMK